MACAWALIVFCLCSGSAVIYWNVKVQEAKAKVANLPEILAKVSAKPTEILSSDGEVLHRIASEYRDPVHIEDVPQVVINATLAAEDKRFYQHSGVDAMGILRMLWVNLRAGHTVQGGSTLTMQLAKRVYTSPSRTFQRKIEDMALATQIENNLSKDKILELYLNQVFYGAGAYGISAAADVYFGKKLNKLTPAEAAMLSRCVRRPSHETPFLDLKKSVENRNVVLKTMLEEGMLTQKDYDSAIKEKVHLNHTRGSTVSGIKRAPYFVDYVLSTLAREMPDVDVSTGGYRIETTLDMRLQAVAEAEVKSAVSKYRRIKVSTAGFVVLDQDGRIRAMVGGVDYNRNQFNVITQGRRQPGSSFKPFVYATALEEGVIGPHDSISNAPFYYTLPDGSERQVKNSHSRYGGSVSIAEAIAQSINVPAVRTIDKVGPDKVVETAHKVFGFVSELGPYLPLALGASEVSPLEMAQGYSVFMLGGDRFTPFAIKEVVAPDGTSIKRWQPEIVKGVLSTTTASAMDGFLRGVVTHGTGTRARRVPNARGKTGTTNSYRDVWFCGYTDRFIGIGWAGNEVRTQMGSGYRWEYKPMIQAYGGTFVAPIWASIIGQAERWGGSKTVKRPRNTETFDYDAGKEDAKAPVDMNDAADIPDDGKADVQPAPYDDNQGGAPATSEPPKPPPRANPGRTGTKGNEADYVYVEVCADSGQRATIYCPERVRRPFRRGSEPKRYCHLHRGAGP